MKKRTFILIVGSVFLSLLLILFISNGCSSNESYADVNNNTVNLLYSDIDGNMGSTSNVGLNSLTVKSNAEIKGELKAGGNTTLNDLSASNTSLNALNVSGNSSLNNNVIVGGSLTVKNRDILSEIDSLKQILTNITNDGNGNITVKGNITSKQLNTDEAILKNIKLGVNTSNRIFYRYNDGLSNDSLYLDGIPVQIVNCGDPTRKEMHTGCNFRQATT